MLSVRLCISICTVTVPFACGSSGSPMGVTSVPPRATATVSVSPSIAFTPGSVSLLIGGTLTINFGSVGMHGTVVVTPPTT
jgi:hypothetical protein